MRRIVYRDAFVCGLLLLLSSCSLFKLQLNENGAEPLSRSALNTRLFTYNYLSTCYSEMENAVDSLQKTASDPRLTARALVWLINNEQALQGSVFQTDPQWALADTWLLTEQMHQFLQTNGDTLFLEGTSLLQEATQNMTTRIDRDANRLLSAKAYQNMRAFVLKESRENPLRELSFHRESLYTDWLKYNNIPDSVAVESVGSLSQTIAGFSERVSVLGEQLGKTSKWNLELAAIEMGITPEKMKAFSDSTAARMEQLVTLINDFPAYFDTTMIRLSTGLETASLLIDRRIALTMSALHQERIALDSMVMRERAAITQQADSIAQHITRVALQEATSMIKSLLLYLSLLFAIILFIPFALGFASGRIFTRNKIAKKEKKEGSLK